MWRLSAATGVPSGSLAVTSADEGRRILSEGWDALSSLAWSADASEIWFTATIA